MAIIMFTFWSRIPEGMNKKEKYRDGKNKRDPSYLFIHVSIFRTLFVPHVILAHIQTKKKRTILHIFFRSSNGHIVYVEFDDDAILHTFKIKKKRW